MPEDGQLTPGDVLDSKYVIEGLIGRGGMGTVYRARQLLLDSPRAIKLMRAELAQDEEFVRRFENEAVLAEGVRHPNVVSLYDFASLPDGTKYIVWELVEGDTIADLLAAGVTFTSAEVAELIGQAAEGLAAAHAQGIFHRDVSPDNLMICSTSDGERSVKVLDFGVAKAPGTPKATKSTTGMVFGKAGYASPEQMGLLEGEISLDARTDVFSLAAVAYTMLTGEPPFVTSNMRSFLHDLMIAPEAEVQDRYLKRLEAPWRKPLARALARDREQRPPSMEAFATDLRTVVAAETSTPARARRGRLVSLLAGAALLLGTTLLLTTRGPSELDPDEATRADIVPEPQPQDPEPERGSSLPPPDPEPETGRSSPPPDPEPETGRSLPPPDPEPDTRRSVPSPDPEPETGRSLPPLDPEPETGRSVPPKIAPDEDGTAASETTSPRKIVDVSPEYPRILKRLGVEGEVVLEGTITADGDVTDLVVVRSTDDRFDKAARDAVRQWKYAPATRNGDPIVINNATFHVSFEMR